MKRKKVLALVLTGVVATSGVLAGCGSSNDAADSNKTQTTDTPDKEQVLNLVGYDFKTLDPSLVSDSESSTSLTNVYEGLMKEVDENGKATVKEAGCEKYELSDDKLTYTFHLRKDAKWTDGKPVTADQYVYSWKRLINPKTGSDYMTLLAELNVKGAQDIIDAADAKKPTDDLVEKLGVEAKDDYTFVVHLEKPTPFFINAMSFDDLVPIREDKVKEQGDKFGSDPKTTVYNGPFTITEYQKGSKIVYTKNDKYWGAKDIKLQTCNGSIINETTTLVKMFEGGELDVTGASKDDLARLKQKAQNKECQYVQGVDTGAYFNYVNVTRPIVKNKKVRQALSLAVDRKEMLDVVYKRCIPSYGIAPEGISCGDKDYRKEVKESIKTDKEQAKKLMTEGLKEEGVEASNAKVTMLFGPKTSTTQAMGDYFQKLYKDTFGINLVLDYSPDSQSYFKKRQASDFDLCGGGWSADYNDVSSYFGVFLGANPNNNSKFKNAEYDKLVKDAASEQDNNKRMDMYKKAEEILIKDEAAVIPTYYADINSFRKNYVKGFENPKFGGYYNLRTVYISGKTK